MKESQKSIKVVSELIAFCFKSNAREIDVNINDKDNEVVIFIKAYIKDMSADLLDKLDELNTPRQTQVEEYYWELAGESNQYQELNLVGMMIDQAYIEYEDNWLQITVFRKK